MDKGKWLVSRPLPSRTVRADFPHTALHQLSPSGLERYEPIIVEECLDNESVSMTDTIKNSTRNSCIPQRGCSYRPMASQRVPFIQLRSVSPCVFHLDAWTRAGLFGFLRFVIRVIPEHERQLAYSVRHRVLAPWAKERTCWLPPLHCSLLSQGVDATMSSSDSSSPSQPWSYLVLTVPPKVIRTSGGVNEVSLGHARHCSHYLGRQPQSRFPCCTSPMLVRLARLLRRITFTFVPG